jgi:hypothetical protein
VSTPRRCVYGPEALGCAHARGPHFDSPFASAAQRCARAGVLSSSAKHLHRHRCPGTSIRTGARPSSSCLSSFGRSRQPGAGAGNPEDRIQSGRGGCAAAGRPNNRAPRRAARKAPITRRSANRITAGDPRRVTPHCIGGVPSMQFVWTRGLASQYLPNLRLLTRFAFVHNKAPSAAKDGS